MTDVLNRVIETIARAGGAMRTSDLVSVLGRMGYSPRRVYSSIESAVKAGKRPRLGRTERVYWLTRYGVSCAARRGVFVDPKRAREVKKNLVKAARDRAKRRDLSRRRHARFRRIFIREGREVQYRCQRKTFVRGRWVGLELPQSVVKEMQAELHRRGLERGIQKLILLSWRIAREQIMAWPALKPKPQPQREFCPPAIDPPRADTPDHPDFGDLIAERMASAAAAEAQAERLRHIENRCRRALDRLELGPARLRDLVPIMNVSTTTAWDRLQAAVDAGMIVMVGKLYALPGAEPPPTLRMRVMKALSDREYGLAELAKLLDEDRTKVKATVKSLMVSGRVVRLGPGRYRMGDG